MMDSVVMFQGTVYEKGYGLIARTVMRDKDLKMQSKAIYAYMCSFAASGNSAERSAFPSIELQIAELGISEKTYYTHRKSLIEKGYIKIEKRKDEKNQYENNLYIICAIPTPIEIEKPIPQNLQYGENLDLEPFEPHSKNYGMENSPYGNFSSKENSRKENYRTKTNSLKSNSSKSNNNPSLTTSSLVAFEILDVRLKNKYPNAPFEQIKAQLLDEAEQGKCVIKTAKQYTAMLEYRLKSFFEPKQAGTAQIRTKAPIRTEYIPEGFDKPYEADLTPEKEDELERKKMKVALSLKKFRGEISEEEYQKGIAVLE